MTWVWIAVAGALVLGCLIGVIIMSAVIVGREADGPAGS